MKACTKCGVEKGADEFHLCAASADRLGSYCKQCAHDYNAQWRKDNAHQHAEQSSKWRRENSEKNKAIKKKWADNNTEKLRESSARQRRVSPEINKAATAKWRKNNQAWATALHARRKAGKVQATPGWTDHTAVGEFYALAAIKTRVTGIPWHVDHIVPLRSPVVCGLHTHYNLQVIPGVDNMRKSNRVWPDMPYLGDA